MGKRILVVDDELLIVDTLAEVLRWDGNEVFCASSGVDALEQLGALMPDVLVTDFMMPLMDGIAFIRELRSRPATAQMPIVLMTAAPMSVTGTDYDVLLAKPFKTQALRAAILRACELRAR